MKTQMEKDRRICIADAAIELLGTQGARALTHRGVDALAGLPVGSTSFYCRTKAELLSLTLMRHAALDMADMQADAARLNGSELTLPGFVDLVVHRVSDWSKPSHRTRLKARFELFLMASRDASFAEVMDTQREGFLRFVEMQLCALQVPDAKNQALALAWMVDGLLLAQARSEAPVMSADQQRALFSGLLTMHAQDTSKP